MPHAPQSGSVTRAPSDAERDALSRIQSPEVRQIEFDTASNTPQLDTSRGPAGFGHRSANGDQDPTSGLSRPLSDTRGLHPSLAYHQEKEVNPDQWHPRFGDPHGSHAVLPSGADTASLSPNPRKKCGLKPMWFWICVFGTAFLVVVVVIVAVVVTQVGKKSPPPPTQPPPPPSQALPISRPHAMNGSGIVALDLNDGNAGFALYSQHHDGEIRKYEFLDDSWTGGFGDDVVVSSNARNGTPLMALSYVIRDELIWRLFYVDVNDTLQEKINSNKTRSGWTDGLLGNGGFKVSSSPQVGLSACRNYRWYGAPYNISDFGIRLYYGGDDHAIHELLWSYGNQAWDTGTVFDDSNGDGGVECTAGPSQPPGITNLWLLNSKGELEQRWYDFNDTSRSPDHLTSTWVKGFTYPHVRKNSAITAITSIGPGQPKLVHFQLANNTVRQLVTTGVAETSEWTEYLDIEERPAIPNSRLGSVVLSTDRGGGKVHVFCQTNGTDITDFIRTLVSDNWFIQSVPTGPA